MSQQNKKVVVLAADNNYLQQITTVIKSICAYNKQVKFYLMNRNIPAEFFAGINAKLAPLESELINIHIDNQDILQYKTYDHINSDATFYRYFIPDLIPEDKVLYLDCDLVVNTDLSILFDIDLGDYPLAAVKDSIANTINKVDYTEFNAGVLLINNKLWKQNHYSTLFIELSNEIINRIIDADQGILNIIFRDRWLQLHRTVNYLIGGDYIFRKFKQEQYLEELNNITPHIVHFNGEMKPWHNNYKTRFRELYWFYHFLDWQQIYQ